MKHIFTYLFLVFGLLVFATRFLMSYSVIDIQQHDTYFVFVYQHISDAISIMLVSIGLLYFFLISKRKKLKTWLGLWHFLLTGFSVYWFLRPILHMAAIAGFPRRYYSFSGFKETQLIDFHSMITVSALVFVLSQILFLINIFISSKIPSK